MVRTVMARTRCTQAKAAELVDRFLAGPQSRAPRGLGALLKQLLLSIPLIGALVKVRRD
jgi:hypothetical protein